MLRPAHRLALLPLVLLLAPLAACGDGDAPPDVAEAPAEDDGCPWIDAPLATGILGEPVTVSTGAPITSDSGTCTLAAEPATTSAWITVMPGYSATLDAELQGSAGTALGPPTPLTDVGDQAAWIDTTPGEGAAQSGSVVAVVGGRAVHVTISRQASAGADPELRGRAVQLAQAVVGAMQTPS